MRDELGNEQHVSLPEDDEFVAPVERQHGHTESRAADSRTVREVYGSRANIERHGLPGAEAHHENVCYYFYPTWRSQLLTITGFFALSALCILISYYVPMLVFSIKLFTLHSSTYVLHFPVLILVPGYLLGKVFIHVYDAKYIIDDGGVEAQIGLVSMNLRQPRLRWEDIRGSEPQQTLWERMLGIGSVGVGSAMTQDVEIVMKGVANPRAIQLLIQSERERRLQELRAPAAHPNRIETVLND